jgi:hypothetical protein
MLNIVFRCPINLEPFLTSAVTTTSIDVEGLVAFSPPFSCPLYGYFSVSSSFGVPCQLPGVTRKLPLTSLKVEQLLPQTFVESYPTFIEYSVARDVLVDIDEAFADHHLDWRADQ